jgi:hypothetical protein
LEIAVEERDESNKKLEIAVEERDESNKKLEIAVEERDESNKKMTISFEERDTVKARVKLFSSFDYATLSDLLSLIERCKLDPVPEDYLANYTKVQSGVNTSVTFATEDVSSVTSSESSLDVLKLNTMRRQMTNATSSKLIVKQLNLEGLDGELYRALFSNNESAFKAFVETQGAILIKLREAMYRIGINKKIWEVTELQPCATLLLEEFVKTLYPNAVVSPGQGVHLEGMLMVGEDTHTAVNKIIKGTTDLIVFKNASDDLDASKAICIVELKTPKGRLYHSAARAPKDQLLFEMEMLGQMGCKPSMVMGGLTDLFAIAIAVRKVVDGICTFYISQRVTGVQEFIKLLLLLLCRDQDSLWELILKQSIKDDICLDDDGDDVHHDEVEHLDREDALSGDLCKDKENIPSGAAGAFSGGRPMSLSFTKQSAIALNRLRDIDRIDEFKEDVSWLLSWDNKRKGFATLTRDALNKMNIEHSKSSDAPYVNKFISNLV